MSTLRLLFLSALSTSVLAACGGGSSTALPAPAPAASGSASGTNSASPFPSGSSSSPSGSASSPAPSPSPAASTPSGGGSLANCPQATLTNVTASDLSSCLPNKVMSGTVLEVTNNSLTQTSVRCAFQIDVQSNKIALQFEDESGTYGGAVFPAKYEWKAAGGLFLLDVSAKARVIGTPKDNKLEVGGSTGKGTRYCVASTI